MTGQAQVLPANPFGGDGGQLSASSILVPLHVDSFEAALAQHTLQAAPVPHGIHAAWSGEDSDRRTPELRRSPPLQTLPDGWPAMQLQVLAAAQATQAAVPRRRASLNITLPADEPASRVTPPQPKSHAMCKNQAAGMEPSWLVHSQDQWAHGSTQENDRSHAAWASESGRRPSANSQQLDGGWLERAPGSGGDGRLALRPKAQPGAAENAVRQAEDKSAGRAAELLRLRTLHSELQSQLEARSTVINASSSLLSVIAGTAVACLSTRHIAACVTEWKDEYR